MLPLYASDGGKEVLITLKEPLYADDSTEVPEFLVGSEVSVHNVTLHRAMPALILGLCVMFAGVLLLCLAVYHSVQGVSAGRLYALGMMALSAGLWRVSYDRVAYLLLPGHTVLVYTVSLLSLMAVALSMLNSLGAGEKGRRLLRIGSCAYCGLYLLQLVLQLTGLADLRQTLTVIHLTIVISAAARATSAGFWASGWSSICYSTILPKAPSIWCSHWWRFYATPFWRGFNFSLPTSSRKTPWRKWRSSSP